MYGTNKWALETRIENHISEPWYPYIIKPAEESDISNDLGISQREKLFNNVKIIKNKM